MINKDSKKLNVTVILPAISGILLGILCYRMVFGKKNNIRIDEKASQKQTSVETSKTEIVNDAELITPKRAKVYYQDQTEEERLRLMEELCKAVLRSDIEFKNGSDFLRELVNITYLNTLGTGWIKKVPRTVRDCEKLLKKLGLWEEYLLKLGREDEYKSIKIFYSSPIPEKSSTRGIKKVIR